MMRSHGARLNCLRYCSYCNIVMILQSLLFLPMSQINSVGKQTFLHLNMIMLSRTPFLISESCMDRLIEVLFKCIFFLLCFQLYKSLISGASKSLVTPTQAFTEAFASVLNSPQRASNH